MQPCLNARIARKQIPAYIRYDNTRGRNWAVYSNLRQAKRQKNGRFANIPKHHRHQTNAANADARLIRLTSFKIGIGTHLLLAFDVIQRKSPRWWGCRHSASAKMKIQPVKGQVKTDESVVPTSPRICFFQFEVVESFETNCVGGCKTSPRHRYVGSHVYNCYKNYRCSEYTRKPASEGVDHNAPIFP